MPVTTRERDISESLFRIYEFHRWVSTNILFPTVPDSIVHPLLKNLMDAEHLLVNKLYDLGEIDRVAAIQKTLKAPGNV
jgi:hypothetical protein